MAGAWAALAALAAAFVPAPGVPYPRAQIPDAQRSLPEPPRVRARWPVALSNDAGASARGGERWGPSGSWESRTDDPALSAAAPSLTRDCLETSAPPTAECTEALQAYVRSCLEQPQADECSLAGKAAELVMAPAEVAFRFPEEVKAEKRSRLVTLGAVAIGPLAQVFFRTGRFLGFFGRQEGGDSAGASPNVGVKRALRACLLLGGMSLAFAVQRSAQYGFANVFGPFFIAGVWGVASGALHTLTGPDHIAGLTALAINQPVGPAVSLASIWASGHVTGQCSIGALLVLLRYIGAPVIKQVLFEQWATFGIAASLLVIGGLGLLEARAGPGEADIRTTGRMSRKLLRGTYTTGFVHGLAPDGLVMLLPVLAMPAYRAAVHLAGIFVGTCAAMSACAAGLCATARRLEQYSVSRGEAMGRMQMRISVASSLVAILLGAVMIVEMAL